MTIELFSFTKNHRLLQPTEFKLVFDAPIKKIHSKHCIVFIKPNQKNTPRLGLAITKKKVKQAVLRNKIKRCTREVFRLHQHCIGDIDLVLIVKISLTKEVDIYAEIAEIFEKIKSLYPKFYL
ncbi:MULTISPECIES: ribonuclease P protein component [unclassified Moraxella]|uniref:ribonuclease P protein component n=1 Tax=unclassified Moraxella TaxID=2685852 RepID=UPI00359EF8A1